MDITDGKAVNLYILDLNSEVIYHCAGYTAVEAAEDEGKELNQAVNVVETENVEATLVYISTETMSLMERIKGSIKKPILKANIDVQN